MLSLEEWAANWNLPARAMQELAESFIPPCKSDATSETRVLSEVAMEASERGARLLRNNSGVGVNPSGRPVRFGLGNTSKQVNAVNKSSDLIGLKTVTITPAMVGMKFGQFMARECKAPEWKYTGTAREQAQLRFLILVRILGGDAAFATGRGSIL